VRCDEEWSVLAVARIGDGLGGGEDERDLDERRRHLGEGGDLLLPPIFKLVEVRWGLPPGGLLSSPAGGGGMKSDLSDWMGFSKSPDLRGLEGGDDDLFLSTQPEELLRTRGAFSTLARSTRGERERFALVGLPSVSGCVVRWWGFYFGKKERKKGRREEGKKGRRKKEKDEKERKKNNSPKPGPSPSQLEMAPSTLSSLNTPRGEAGDRVFFRDKSKEPSSPAHFANSLSISPFFEAIGWKGKGKGTGKMEVE